MYLIDKKLKHNLRRYIFQCSLAAIAILIILIILDVFCHSAIIATLGATLFIVFTMPKSRPSRPRPLIGGYIVGVVVGLLFYYIGNSTLVLSLLVNIEISYIVFGSLAVGTAIFLMTVTDTEHPPAAGIPIALIFSKWDYLTIIFIISAVIILFIIKSLLRPMLVDLR